MIARARHAVGEYCDSRECRDLIPIANLIFHIIVALRVGKGYGQVRSSRSSRCGCSPSSAT